VDASGPPANITNITWSPADSAWQAGLSYTFIVTGTGFGSNPLVTIMGPDNTNYYNASCTQGTQCDTYISGLVQIPSSAPSGYAMVIVTPVGFSGLGFGQNPPSPPPVTWEVPVTAGASVCAVPTNFSQQDPGVVDQCNPGILDFSYQWSSSTGRLSDLSNCEVGENVVFDPADIPYPSPPFPPDISPESNPVIRSFSAVWGSGQDTNGTTGLTADQFVKPYSWRAVNTQQTFRYRCTCYNSNAWTSFTNLINGYNGAPALTEIEAVKETYTGRGYWLYLNQKPNLPPAFGQVPSAAATITLH